MKKQVLKLLACTACTALLGTACFAPAELFAMDATVMERPEGAVVLEEVGMPEVPEGFQSTKNLNGIQKADALTGSGTSGSAVAEGSDGDRAAQGTAGTGIDTGNPENGDEAGTKKPETDEDKDSTGSGEDTDDPQENTGTGDDKKDDDTEAGDDDTETGDDGEDEEEEDEEEEETVKVTVKSLACSKKGVITVKFDTKVETEKVKAVLTDDYGEKLKVSITKKTNKAVTIQAVGLVKGCDYTLTLSGLRADGQEEYETVKKTFTPTLIETSLKTKSITQKWKEGRLVVVVTCDAQVYTKDASVVLKDTNGNKCTAKFVSTDGSQIKINVTAPEKGKTYKAVIYGTKTAKETNYGSVSITLKVK